MGFGLGCVGSPLAHPRMGMGIGTGMGIGMGMGRLLLHEEGLWVLWGLAVFSGAGSLDVQEMEQCFCGLCRRCP